MIGEPAWLTARGGDDVDINVAVVFPGERDQRAVRGEMRPRFVPDTVG